MLQGVGSLIGGRVPLAMKPHRVEVHNPSGAPIADGDGEYTQDYAMTGYEYGAVEPATPARLERFTRSGNIAAASHVVTFNYRTDISTRTRLYYNGRRLDVLGFASERELGVELQMVCQEIVP